MFPYFNQHFPQLNHQTLTYIFPEDPSFLDDSRETNGFSMGFPWFFHGFPSFPGTAGMADLLPGAGAKGGGIAGVPGAWEPVAGEGR
jgi:hypothetical protein